MNWSNVRRIQEEVAHHRPDALGVDGFEDHRRSRLGLLVSKSDKAQLIAGLEVLDDLCAEQAPKRFVGKRFKVGKQVLLYDVEALFQAQQILISPQLHAPCSDMVFAHQLKELAPPAPYIDDVFSAAKTFQVVLLTT